MHFPFRFIFLIKTLTSLRETSGKEYLIVQVLVALHICTLAAAFREPCLCLNDKMAKCENFVLATLFPLPVVIAEAAEVLALVLSR